MEASKVTISDRTLLQAPTLRGGRKRELRIKVLKDYIQTRPYGERITTRDIQKLLHFGTAGNAWQFMEKILKKGVVLKHEITPRTFFYTVNEPVTTTHLPTDSAVGKILQPAAEFQPSELGKIQDLHTIILGHREYTLEQLEQKAMKYLYYYDADNVKDFLKWLTSQEG